MKFDIAVGNLPFKFTNEMLKTMFNYSNVGYIITPSPPFLNNKWNKNKSYKKIQILFKNSIKEITILNSKKIWPFINIPTPVIILNYDKNYKNNNFAVNDQNINVQYSHNNIDTLHQYSYDSNFISLKEKYENYCNKNNILDNRISLNNKSDFKWFIRLPSIRGNISKNNSQYSTDFYTFIPKDKSFKSRQPLKSISNKIVGNKDNHIIGFKTKKECQNFINSLELYTIRFGLAITKNSRHLDRGELKTVPFFKDYSKPITEEFVIKELGITQEEYKFIRSIIPKYYEK